MWWAALTAAFLLTRPYGGIDGDARLYIGSALAALDPDGIGQDLMFRRDGQFGFSAHPALLTGLVRALGPSTAAMIASAAGAVAWLAGAGALARGLADKHGRAAAFAAAGCMIVLPAQYGAFGAFSYGEISAVPRPLAEGAVMGALAALLAGRAGCATILMAAGAAIHPLIALPGLVAALLMLALKDRRWLMVAAGVLVTALTAGAAGLPVADRLVAPIDPAWLAVLKQRSAPLFVSQWPPDAWGRLIVHLVTALIAATAMAGPRRRIFLAVAAAGVAGFAVSAVFGDRWPMLLVVQVQAWRALWLLAVFAAAGLALAGGVLARSGAQERVVLALIAAGWMLVDAPAIAAPVMAAALGLRLMHQSGRSPIISPLVERTVFVATALLAVIWLSQRLVHLAAFFAAAHRAGAHPGWPYVLAAEAHVLPLVVLAIALAGGAWKLSRRSLTASAILAAGAAAAALALWDGRLPGRRMIDTSGRPAALAAALGPRPGPILWVGGDTEAWLLAGRANWANRMQAGGAVFSRDLALDWQARVQALVAAGLAAPADLAPFTVGVGEHPLLRPSPEGVRSLCVRQDGPVAIVIPEATAASTPPGAPPRIWRAPVSSERLSAEGGRFVWRPVRSFTVIRCSEVSAPRP